MEINYIVDFNKKTNKRSRMILQAYMFSHNDYCTDQKAVSMCKSYLGGENHYVKKAERHRLFTRR